MKRQDDEIKRSSLARPVVRRVSPTRETADAESPFREIERRVQPSGTERQRQERTMTSARRRIRSVPVSATKRDELSETPVVRRAEAPGPQYQEEERTARVVSANPSPENGDFVVRRDTQRRRRPRKIDAPLQAQIPVRRPQPVQEIRDEEAVVRPAKVQNRLSEQEWGAAESRPSVSLREEEKVRVQPARVDRPRRDVREGDGELALRRDIHTPGELRLTGVRRPLRAQNAGIMKPRQDGAGQDTASFAHDKTLKFRHELKFYINYRDYVVLRQCIKGLINVDENADDTGTYYIRSLYFDDRDETALVDKLAGVDERGKFRIRIYNFKDDKIRFEKKIKKGQYIAKKSMLLSKKELYAILDGNPAFLLRRPEPLARELFLEMRLKQLRPKVFVDYEREAYILPYESVRITFDKNLKSGSALGDIFDPDLPLIPIAEKETMILEVKFNKYLPDYIKKVLNNLSAPQRSAISKYTLCRKYE